MNTLIFDLHGIIYTHDKNNSILNSKKIYNSIILSKKPISDIEELNLEFKSIKDALNHHENQLNIYPIPNAIEKLLYHIKKHDKVVIVSSSKVETQKLILKTFLKDEKLIHNIDFYNSTEYGPKNKVETWHQILKNYEDITEVYEDNPDYLDAASYAVKQLGNKFGQFSKVI